MKCDELKQVENPIEWGLYYNKSEVDAAIAELKTALNESEEARYEAGADAADYYQENQRLKRALFKACANWAHVAVAFFSSYATKEKWRKMENKCRAKKEEYK